MSVVVSVDSVAHAKGRNEPGAEDEVFIQLMCIAFSGEKEYLRMGTR
jgi:hypothetical protein